MVGSRAAEVWAARGHQVTVLDNLMRSRLFGSDRESVEYNWRFLDGKPGIRLIKGDVRSIQDVATALGDGVDVVLHAAGQPGVGYSIEHPEEDFQINAFGTLQVLEQTRRRCPQAVFLFCSTNKVYGTNVDAVKLVEHPGRYAFANGFPGISERMSVDLAGHTPYGVSKLAAEQYVQDYAHTFGMRTAVFRMSCLASGVKVATMDGNIPISALEGKAVEVHCLNDLHLSGKATAGSFSTLREGKTLYRVRTKRGYEIEATGDHRFLTPAGYVALDRLCYGSFVAISPETTLIERRPTDTLPGRVIVTAEALAQQLRKYRRRDAYNVQACQRLEQLGLVPLRYNNPQMYRLARLVGYLTGDGHLSFRIRPSGKAYTEIQVSALREEIEDIMEEFRRLGFRPGRIRASYSASQLRSGHVIRGMSYKFSVTQTDAFALFELLGVPVGHKSKIAFRVPPWILRGPAALQDEYLRGLFGAELNAPSFYRRKGRDRVDLQVLQFAQSKQEPWAGSARAFRRELMGLLKRRGIHTRPYTNRFYYVKGGERSRCFQFVISPSRDNVLRFARIGYALNRARQRRLCRMAEFLKTDLPLSHAELWIEEHTRGLQDCDAVWDQIMEKTPIPMTALYDVTVPVHHNFIANGFVVHNCIYGTRQFGFEDQGWVAHFTIQTVMGRPITIYGDGKQVRDVLFVDDLIDAYDRFLESHVRHGVFNVGGGPTQTVSLQELLELLATMTGQRSPVTYADWRPSDQRVYVSDVRHLQQTLGWSPRTAFPEGLRRLHDWVQANRERF